jgi:hypothetical protein
MTKPPAVELHRSARREKMLTVLSLPAQGRVRTSFEKGWSGAVGGIWDVIRPGKLNAMEGYLTRLRPSRGLHGNGTRGVNAVR